jgi:hypothetical protein
MAKLKKENKNKNFVVMEILTKQGASLQPNDYTSSGNIQSLEHEMILPRRMKLRIVKTKKSNPFVFGGDRPDLASKYYGHYSQLSECRKGDKVNLPVIQMIDEKLIAETKE